MGISFSVAMQKSQWTVSLKMSLVKPINRQEIKVSIFFLIISTFNYYLFIYFYLFIFLAVLGLRFCARAFSSCREWGHSSSWCAGLSPSRPLLLRSTGSRRAGSVVVAHGPSCSAACGIFPDQGSNPCPLHWQADSQPLRHQGSPKVSILIFKYMCN